MKRISEAELWCAVKISSDKWAMSIDRTGEDTEMRHRREPTPKSNRVNTPDVRFLRLCFIYIQIIRVCVTPRSAENLRKSSAAAVSR